ncbi:MAG: NAD-binding protein, partial [Spirochaetales bacterium]|nr:NAD-binding protein [Spirochaetales bacterium]
MTNPNIIIIGAGSIGFQLAKRLSRDNYNISMIESDPERANYAKEHVDARVIEGYGSSQKKLMEADIANADILAALTNNDEVHLISCAIAKTFGVPTTIARVRNPEYRSREFALYGSDFSADYVIQPERQAANVIVRLIRQSNATDVIEFEGGKFQLVGLRLDPNAQVLNTPLIELADKLSSLNLRIVAIKRGQFTIIPRGQDLLIKGDQIFIISSKDEIPDALEFFGKSDKKLENIMIIGGGQIGMFIAKELEKDINVKILESNADRSEALADELKHALVIKGDGSDIDLLAFEGLPDMDDFVAV